MARAIGVSMMPGCTMATRTPNGFISCASASLKASSANFEAAYEPSGDKAIFPATEVTLMMQPLLRSRMPVSTWRMQRSAPK